ncbi:serine/threonine protein kinase [bacterium]|nr:serine/threonine protein kinase [Akkermansiaceae bacterium]MDA7898469.1 serine/threonine protein kinase [bacterium]MDA7538217.1 serine/threonine protein kinase [Akkermansiaceae bacterium]MDB4041211.1 serine/threonine protein kinase [Akkermansiaceae bacterium]MDB4259225.1 serine/threonine protein kinase [Akkermansiaceae bacterium]
MDPQERYEIKRKLGQGGLGAVFEGFDHQLQRKVAIKRLLTEGDNTQEEVDDLMRECHSLSALNSPNIVSLFDIGQDQDGPFVVMELLDGETLEDLISRAPLIEGDFVSVAEQCLEGLLAAHDANLLHRDIKPCNIMITWLPSGRMQLKLLDFGLAKFATEPSIQTIAHGNSLFGSIYFMAPEQFEQHPLDARTDLYSLGSVFYYSLTAEYPFNGESVAQVMASHLQGHYKDLREYRPDLPEALCNWVMSLMSRGPEKRPKSCEEALSQLLGVRQGTFTPAAPDGVEMITHPVRLKAAPAVQADVAPSTKTMQLQIPGTAPVYVTTQPVLMSSQAGGQPKWLWPVMIIGVLIVAFLFWPEGNDESDVAKKPPTVIEKPAEKSQKKEPQKKETLADRLRLPKSPGELLEKRDKNLDRMLSLKEFSDEKSPVVRRRLEEAFTQFDLDENGRIILSELEEVYRKM